MHRKTQSISSHSTLSSIRVEAKGKPNKFKTDFTGRLDLASKVAFDYAVKGFPETSRAAFAKSKQLKHFQMQFSKSRAELLDTESEQRLPCPLSTKRLLEAARAKLLVEGRNFDNRIYNNSFKPKQQTERSMVPEEIDRLLPVKVQVRGGSLAASKSQSMLECYFDTKLKQEVTKQRRQSHEIDFPRALAKIESRPIRFNPRLTSEQKQRLNSCIEFRLDKVKHKSKKAVKHTHLFVLQFNRTRSQPQPIDTLEDEPNLFMTEPIASVRRSSSVSSLFSLPRSSKTADKLEGLKTYCNTVRQENQKSRGLLSSEDASLKNKFQQVKTWLQPKNRTVDPDYMMEHINIFRKERGELLVIKDKRIVMRL